MAFINLSRSPFLTRLTQEASSERARTIPLAYSLDLRQVIAALLRLDVSDRCPTHGSCFSTLSQSHDVAAKGVKAYMSSIALPFARIANLDSLPRDRRRVKCWRLRRLHCIYLNESVGLCHGKSTASRRRGGRLSRKAL